MKCAKCGKEINDTDTDSIYVENNIVYCRECSCVEISYSGTSYK